MAEPPEPVAASPRSGFAAPDGEFGEQLQQLAHVTAELAAAETIDAVVEVAVTRVAEAVRARVVTLMLRDEDTLTLVGTHGMQAGVIEQWASFSVSDRTPASEATRTGAPVIVADLTEFEPRYPAFRGQMPPGRCVVCLPMSAGQKPLGVIGLAFDEGWVPGPRELDFLTTFADTCAQAIRRIHSMELAEEKTTQLTFLAEASDELSASLDYRATLAKVARLAVRSLADWCVVDILRDGELATLAVEHVDPDQVAWAWELQERYPPHPHGATGAPKVARTGVSELYPEITDEMLAAGARDPEHLRLTRELHLHSALVVPLSARGRTLGAITLVRSHTGRPYTRADLAVAEDLGRRAGMAIDNALLYSQTQDVALQLQRAVLPEQLNAVPGWEIATHYSPGGDADVGGDFYDAIPLADGRLVVFIGDVMGHGVAAAAAMAHMRAAVRAFVSIDPEPSAVMSNLDTMFERLAISQLVSLAYAVINPDATQLRLVSAGHYPPLLVDPDARTRYAEAPPQRVLGAGSDTRGESVWTLQPGGTVLLYTDGLVERRGESIQVGLSRLTARAGTLSTGPLREQLEHLAAQLHEDSGTDDVTAIAVRRAPTDT